METAETSTDPVKRAPRRSAVRLNQAVNCLCNAILIEFKHYLIHVWGCIIDYQYENTPS